jgi:eukaryotic-like serine/threonine-protein kinase
MNERGGLADYTIEREIGRGTMGAVYLARTPAPESLEVAIKRVPTFGSAEDRERLRREAETMAQLDHPNVMAVLDVLDDGEGIALVMPYAANGNLTKRLAMGALSPEVTKNVILPIGEALASAHDRGILHRDVKPSKTLRRPTSLAPIWLSALPATSIPTKPTAPNRGHSPINMPSVSWPTNV